MRLYIFNRHPQKFRNIVVGNRKAGALGPAKEEEVEEETENVSENIDAETVSADTASENEEM